MSLITKANFCYRKGNINEALENYKNIVSKYQRNSASVHKLIYNYAKSQIKVLDPISDYKFSTDNIVLTSVNSKYFQTVIVMIESIYETSFNVVNKIVIFDFGLEKWQREILEKNKKVEVFQYENIPNEPRLEKFSIDDTSTYFFKVYALHYWDRILKYKNPDDVNILWIDSGIKVQKELKEIFYIIDSEGCFFVDHSDVEVYYKNPQNCLVNILSPKIFENNKNYETLSNKQLLVPYIKANFFGIKTSGKYSYLMTEHLDMCLDTDVLFEPRDIKDTKDKNYWINHTTIKKEIEVQGLKNSGMYMNGRHEQTIWSYLVARDSIKIYNSKRFNFTVSPGSGTQNKETWERRIVQLLDEDYNRYKESIMIFLKDTCNLDEQELKKLEENNNQAKKMYISEAKDIYFDNPRFLSPAFPVPNESKYSTVLLHRGSMAKIDHERYIGKLLNNASNIKEEPFILMGNGPSLGDVDFNSLKGMHTMGLNAAYRQYKKINFWPKYFGCFDGLVCQDHSSEFKKLIKKSPIEKFFFINLNDNKDPIFTEDEILLHDKFQNIDFRYRSKEEIYNLSLLSTTFKPFIDMRTSGPNSIQTALIMGYRKIIMLGVDQNYVEVVDGAGRNGDYHKLIMEETPDANPNYWFSDYQVKGDKFNRPNLQGSQISSWDNLSKTLDNLGVKVEIYNCSPITGLKSFKKASLSFALKKFNSIKSLELDSFKTQLN